MERAWESHEGLRGGDGEESGQQGPRGAGVLTSLRGRRPLPGARRAVRGSGSRRAGPASFSPSPTGPSPAPPDRSPQRGPGHSLCKRRPSKAVGSLPNRSAYLGTGPICPLGGRERPEQGWRPGQRGRDQNGDGDRGRTREKRVLRRTAVLSAPVSPKGRRKRVRA